MTIDEAIKISQAVVDRRRGVWFVGELEAVELGVEALKWRQRFTQALPRKGFNLLPGESKE